MSRAGHFVPPSHPRYRSLMEREKLVKAFEEGVVVPQGLIAHGRGEAFDYILGEATIEPARRAVEATAALLLLSKRPVISVNGNTAALVGEELVKVSNEFEIPLEVNLFYRTEERVKKINEYLKRLGAKHLVECEEPVRIPGLESERGKVCEEGIFKADAVLVALEDGDRTEALKRMGKRVAAVDLNPLSRTAMAADITIVDNVTRAVPLLATYLKQLSERPASYLEQVLSSYDNSKVLGEVLSYMARRLALLSGSLASREQGAEGSSNRK